MEDKLNNARLTKKGISVQNRVKRENGKRYRLSVFGNGNIRTLDDVDIQSTPSNFI